MLLKMKLNIGGVDRGTNFRRDSLAFARDINIHQCPRQSDAELCKPTRTGCATKPPTGGSTDIHSAAKRII
jgi:hypothetical protein